jgi:hypothetical protein
MIRKVIVCDNCGRIFDAEIPVGVIFEFGEAYRNDENVFFKHYCLECAEKEAKRAVSGLQDGSQNNLVKVSISVVKQGLKK